MRILMDLSQGVWSRALKYLKGLFREKLILSTLIMSILEHLKQELKLLTIHLEKKDVL
jgi:hypothetical protein